MKHLATLTLTLSGLAMVPTAPGTPGGPPPAAAGAAMRREAKLVRYPHYHRGRVAFTYLGDIWTADEGGRDVRRLTVHVARDVYPRFSPDGRWIAFSSDRDGNLDVYVMPADGGEPKQLTFHSADDNVQGWTPDGKAVLFASNRGDDFAGKLYTVDAEGGRMERPTGVDMGVYGSFSPDGRRLAYNQKSQAYWRKGYRGSASSDVVVMDAASKKFSTLTDYNGEDRWPMWGADRFIYFVSDREGDVTNLWRVPAEGGGQAERVTSFRDGDVRWPSMSADGKTIVFEHDFGIWKLDVASRQAAPIKLDIAAETQQSTEEVREFSSQADDFGLAPSGRRIVVSVHGELFTVPTAEEGGDLVQITESPARDRSPEYSPDGRWIAYVSDSSGREEIYVKAADGAGAARRVTNLDALKTGFVWSPDSREILFAASDNVLRKVGADGGRTVELARSTHGNIGAASWSPDGKWIAFSKPDFTRTSDVYVIPSTGGEERRITTDSYNDIAPRFSPDGRRLYFLRVEGGFGQGQQPTAQLWAVTLDREERDPNDPEERAAGEPPTPRAVPQGDSAAGGAGGGAGAAARGARPAPETKIEWTTLRRRTRQLTRMPFAVTSYDVSPDGRTVAFVTSEPAGLRSVPVVYTIQPDGRRLTRVASGGAGGGGGDDDGPPQGGGGFGGGLSGLTWARDGRTLYFRESNGVYAVSVASSGGAAGGGAGAMMAAAGREGARRRINFAAKVRIDRPAEWAEMFGDAWRTMKYRFYDPKMHGRDWDAMRAKYEPLVQYAGDRQEVLNLINEMIGELNASHTGAAPPAGERRPGAVSTGHLGVELEPDEGAGRYRVAHVFEDGPADKDWVRVSAGDYLIAINGRPVKAGDNYWALLNNRLNRKVEVTFNSKATPEGAWKTRIEPVTQQAYGQLRYERWVKQRRDMVAKLGSGRVGYLHIQAMNAPSLRRFEKELRENRDKEALVIDQRWNGGGNIEQELLAILVQRQYQVWQPRGTEETTRPLAGFFGPKVVLQNFRSGSNAEMFPAGFRALGLGKTIGTPTAGAVIGTGSYSLIDGSTVRTPGVGVYLADEKRTNMENYGVPPDILVENTPEDHIAGRDRQLERAVQELLKELEAKGAKVKTN